MGWRDYAKEIQGAGHTRHTRHDSSPSAPSVPNVPSVPGVLPLNRDRALKRWVTALEMLDPCQPREGFSMGRWQKLYDCSVWWIESFGRQAALDGWGTSDVFGVVPQVEGHGGLIDQLGDHRGLVMTADEARWRWRGVRPQVYRRGSWPGLAPWWDAFK